MFSPGWRNTAGPECSEVGSKGQFWHSYITLMLRELNRLPFLDAIQDAGFHL